MKKIFQIVLIFFANVNAFGDDSIPKIYDIRKNEIQLAVSGGGAYNFGLYHTLGYSRLFSLKGNSYLGIYGGLGYLPPKSKQLFAHKIGFDGYKLYAHTARIQFVQVVKNIGIYSALEYTYLAKNIYFSYINQHHFIWKFGVEFYIFKKHLSLSPQIGIGYATLQDPYDPPYNINAKMITLGLDIGFCF
jgi:hypothetical protein